MRLRRALLATPVTVLAILAASPAVSHAATHHDQAKTHNANFKGTWVMSTGYSFTIKTENTRTGRCTGTQSYGSAYRLRKCVVHGHHFRFEIIAPSDGAYSDYRGKFKTHKLHGQWTPDTGGGGAFTATRAKVK